MEYDVDDDGDDAADDVEDGERREVNGPAIVAYGRVKGPGTL